MSSSTSNANDDDAAPTFAVGHRVVLQGLKGAAEHNGKVGVVQSDLNAGGRHEVELVGDSSDGGKKILGIKPVNLMFEPRPLESLSVAELKFLLTSSSATSTISPKEFTGMDKSDLRNRVSQSVATDPNELAKLLSKRARPQGNDSSTNKKKSSSKKRNVATSAASGQHHQAAEQISNMSPEQLMQQAQMMRSMDKATLRQMNPQMGGMSDAQIEMAIQQLEMMAMNPDMVKQAADQMKNMSAEEFEQQKQQVMGGGGAGATAGSVDPGNMSPEQLRQQAKLMRTMDPDSIRRMNPALANATDDMIRMAADQMEQMAENPEMMKFAKEQMKNMSPEDMMKMQQSGALGAGAGGGGTGGGVNPTQMLKDMKPEQLKQMVRMMKQNPEMMKQMLPGGGMGMGEDQINKTIEALGNMDEAQLEKTLQAAQMFQTYTEPIQNAWNKANAVFCGQLRRILMLLFSLGMAMLFRYLFLSSASTDPSSAATVESNIGVGDAGDVPVMGEQDEFSEF